MTTDAYGVFTLSLFEAREFCHVEVDYGEVAGHCRKMSARFCGSLFSAAFGLLWLAVGAHGQGAGQAKAGQAADSVAKRDGSTDARSEIEAFHNAKMALLEEMAQVKAKAAAGGSQAQREAVESWQKGNEARMQAIQQQAVAIANGRRAVEPLPVGEADFPANVSEDVKALVKQRARDYNDQVATDRRLRESPGQADAISKSASKVKDDGEALRVKLAQAVADQGMRQPFVPALEMEIPDGVSAEVRALLAERNALLRERAEAQARQPLRDGQTQEDWLLKWNRTKSDRLQNLQQKAQQAAEK